MLIQCTFHPSNHLFDEQRSVTCQTPPHARRLTVLRSHRPIHPQLRCTAPDTTHHALHHAFLSLPKTHGKRIAAFVTPLDQRTARHYTRCVPKDKRKTVESIPFEP